MAMNDPTLDLARPREGRVDIWVRVVVVAAIASTLVVLLSAPRVVWERDRETIGIDRFTFENALAAGVMTLLALVLLPPGRGSRFVRLAVALPVIQIVVMLAAFVAWTVLAHRMPSAQDATPLLEKLPVRVVLPWLALATGAGGWLAARKRRRERLHAVVMLALVNLLLLGLWLPMASNVWNGHGSRAWEQIAHALDTPNGMIVFVLVPPFVGALAFTATALRWPQVWRRHSAGVIALLLLALFIGVAMRREVSELGAFIYLNFVHVIAASALVAVASITVLGISTWVGNARARALLEQPGVLVGTILSRHPIAILELTSWLRGPRPACTAFVVETPYGEVPVPAGARVVAPTPLATTLLRTGEIVQVLKPGDRVALAGYVHARSGEPFRATSAPIAGATGITVGRLDQERDGFSSVGLDLWRPSVAYLLILVALLLPALAALLSKQF
jgi:hypothetical protein